MGRHDPADHLEWRTTNVDGRRVHFGVAGHGLPVLFIHGWALGSHTYKRSLKRLVRMGCQVYAPALPGFGGSAGLPGKTDLTALAAWSAGFLDAVGVSEPVLAIGHSFGGAVAAKIAHDYPERVGYLVLINSIGGAIWSDAGDKVRSMADRPLWDWAVNFPLDVVVARGALRVVRAILEDAVPNLLTNPLGLWTAAGIARTADLTGDLVALRASGIPVLVVQGEGDTIIPRASFRALCTAIGCEGELVPGRHSWLLADPDAFGKLLAGPVAEAKAARDAPVVPLYATELGRAASG